MPWFFVQPGNRYHLCLIRRQELARLNWSPPPRLTQLTWQINVLAALQPQAERIQKYAAAVLAPRHGVFVMAKDLLAGYDALERVDVNAYCVLMSRFISG